MDDNEEIDEDVSKLVLPFIHGWLFAVSRKPAYCFGIWVSRYMDLYLLIYILTVLQCSMLQCVTVYILNIYIS